MRGRKKHAKTLVIMGSFCIRCTVVHLHSSDHLLRGARREPHASGGPKNLAICLGKAVVVLVAASFRGKLGEGGVGWGGVGWGGVGSHAPPKRTGLITV